MKQVGTGMASIGLKPPANGSAGYENAFNMSYRFKPPWAEFADQPVACTWEVPVVILTPALASLVRQRPGTVTFPLGSKRSAPPEGTQTSAQPPSRS